MEYYLLRDGEQSGPYTEDALRASLQSGEVSPSDLAWCASAGDWTQVGTLIDVPVGDPPTSRQQAFLAFMGVTAPGNATRQQAAMLVNDAVEKDPSRLTRWNAERLQLHPDIFAEEIQARKEGRPQRYFERCQREGLPWFDKVAKAHCQVIVRHLDVDSLHWDADESAAVEKHFFPALARKFPQLLTPEGRVHFQASEQPKSADTARKRSSPVSNSSRESASAGRKILALARGAIYGALILVALWFSRGQLEKLAPAPKTTAASQAEPAKAEKKQKLESEGEPAAAPKVAEVTAQ